LRLFLKEVPMGACLAQSRETELCGLMLDVKAWAGRLLVRSALPWLLALGCSTSGSPSGGVGSATGGTSGNLASGGNGGVTTQATANCPEAALPRTPLRRLTRYEYGNVVSDLLGVDTSAVAELPADEVTNSFDNNAAVLTVSSLHAEKYVLVSEALAKRQRPTCGD
jgi:hypothetical protein